MQLENLALENSEGIAFIRINRPKKLNALNIDTLKELDQVIDQVIHDSSVRNVILTGEGEKAFAAGADVAEFSDFSSQQAKELAQNTHQTLNKIENAPKPFLAAINGFALGGGCELAMACHLRVASSHARLGQPEVGLGLIPGYGGTQRLTRLIGKTKALEFLLSGAKITAAQAENLGLINAMVEPGELMEYCQYLLNQIGQQSPMAIAKIIKTVNAFEDKNEDGLKKEIEEFADCFGKPDFKEGVDAFLNKRSPEFKEE